MSLLNFLSLNLATIRTWWPTRRKQPISRQLNSILNHLATTTAASTTLCRNFTLPPSMNAPCATFSR